MHGVRARAQQAEHRAHGHGHGHRGRRLVPENVFPHEPVTVGVPGDRAAIAKAHHAVGVGGAILDRQPIAACFPALDRAMERGGIEHGPFDAHQTDTCKDHRVARATREPRVVAVATRHAPTGGQLEHEPRGERSSEPTRQLTGRTAFAHQLERLARHDVERQIEHRAGVVRRTGGVGVPGRAQCHEHAARGARSERVARGCRRTEPLESRTHRHCRGPADAQEREAVGQ